MAERLQFEHSVAFAPESAAETLRAIPALPGVFALHGPPAAEGQSAAQPYLTRAADLRRRITRLLAPPDSQSKRLNLRTRVARIDYTVTGSDFESTLTLYHASAAVFGVDEARRRLKLRTPFFLRFTADNDYPRVYSTNRLSKRALSNFYGPFPSRAAADRYCDAVLDLFKLRRCVEDLEPYPEHPGCVYQEMKKCLAPCNQACTSEGAAAYAHEAAEVKRFFDTHGESMIIDIGLAREEASNALHFERAAELHAQWHKVKAVQALAGELVQPIPKLRAVIVQKATQGTENIEQGAVDSAAIFLLKGGCLSGPTRLSVLGVRAVKEQTSVGSSLFAQPLMLQAIPLEESTPTPVTLSANENSQDAVILNEDATAVASHPDELDIANAAHGILPPIPAPTTLALNPEARAAAVIASLEEQASAGAAPPDLATLSDHLSLLRRWYYRPEKQRIGEVFFPKEDGAAANKETAWPIRRILNGSARIALGDPKPMAETHREFVQPNPADEPQKPARTKILHEGRSDVERVVPVIDKPASFKSRRKPQAR